MKGSGRGWLLVAAVLVIGLVVVFFRTSDLFKLDVPEPVQPSTIALSSQRLSFGEVPVRGSTVRQLILKNDSASPIETWFEIGGLDYSIAPARLLIQPGEIQRLSVTVSPREVGDLDDELWIFAGDGQAEPLIVALEGQAYSASDRALAASAGATPPGSTAGGSAVSAAQGGARGVQVQGVVRAGGVVASPGGSPAGQRVLSGTQPAGGSMVMTSLTGDAVTAGPEQAGTAGQDVNEKQTEASRAQRAAAEDELPPEGHKPRGAHGNVIIAPYDPLTSAPVSSLAEATPLPPEHISDEEAAGAREVPSKIRELEDDGRDGLPEDLAEEDPLDQDPMVSPSLNISGLSSMTLIGSTVQFYPQEVIVLGTVQGGPFNLVQPIQFPLVPLAFGESMLFGQTGLAAGTFDPGSGQVALEFVLEAVDSEGHSAPLIVPMTTGTAVARNDAGMVVSMVGTPRNPGTGLVKLVGIGKIPMGFRNGAENRAVFVEILATLNFGTTISALAAPRPDGAAQTEGSS
jgi:hypothetical protein